MQLTLSKSVTPLAKRTGRKAVPVRAMHKEGSNEVRESTVQRH
jgi:hypothetical protein